jgi:hypothetical protein
VAPGLNRHRGNCGRIVTNVAIATELEHLDVRLAAREKKLGGLNAQIPSLQQAVESTDKMHGDANIELAVERQQLDQLIENGETNSATFSKAAVAHHTATTAAEDAETTRVQARTKLEHAQAQREKTLDAIEQMTARAVKLEPLREIRQLDVALDTVLTAMKLTLAMLITFVLREYLPSAGMGTETFLNRIFRLRGRRETTADREHIVIYENPRDPRANAAIVEACNILNARALVRDDRTLSFAVEQRPP